MRRGDKHFWDLGRASARKEKNEDHSTDSVAERSFCPGFIADNTRLTRADAELRHLLWGPRMNTEQQKGFLRILGKWFPIWNPVGEKKKSRDICIFLSGPWGSSRTVKCGQDGKPYSGLSDKIWPFQMQTHVFRRTRNVQQHWWNIIFFFALSRICHLCISQFLRFLSSLLVSRLLLFVENNCSPKLKWSQITS